VNRSDAEMIWNMTWHQDRRMFTATGNDMAGNFKAEGKLEPDGTFMKVTIQKNYTTQHLNWVYSGVIDKYGMYGTWGDRTWVIFDLLYLFFDSTH
jgi:hypothetical protein